MIVLSCNTAARYRGRALIITIITFAANAQSRGASAFRSGFKLWKGLRTAAVCPAARRVGCGQRFVHDSADGPCTAAALRAAAKAAIDFAGSPGRFLAGKRRADVVVGQHIAGANDHRSTGRRPFAGVPLVAAATI
jgi:hypothetical protein